MYQSCLEIAGIRIRINSKSNIEEEDPKNARRFESFIKKKGGKKFDIALNIEAVKKLPALKNKKILFEVRRTYSGKKRSSFDWIIYQLGKSFLIESRMGEKYNAVFNRDFTSGKVYIKQAKGVAGWKMTQLVFGPLQVMIMHYLAIHKLGVLVHSSGIRHKNDGFLFVGPTRAGKSTSARLWKAAGNVDVLNDDRIVIRKVGKDFYIFGTPWHGDFSDYLETIASKAPLRKIFFIYHHAQNKVTPLRSMEAFHRFFPNIFPIFWDKQSLDFTADFLCEVLDRVPSFGLGFLKEQSAVSHVRAKLAI